MWCLFLSEKLAERMSCWSWVHFVKIFSILNVQFLFFLSFLLCTATPRHILFHSFHGLSLIAIASSLCWRSWRTNHFLITMSFDVCKRFTVCMRQIDCMGDKNELLCRILCGLVLNEVFCSLAFHIQILIGLSLFVCLLV